MCSVYSERHRLKVACRCRPTKRVCRSNTSSAECIVGYCCASLTVGFCIVYWCRFSFFSYLFNFILCSNSYHPFDTPQWWSVKSLSTRNMNNFLNVDWDMSIAHTAITLRVVTSRVGVALGDQNLPLLPQPFAKTFGVETFAKLFYLTFRMDFLLQFWLIFNS